MVEIASGFSFMYAGYKRKPDHLMLRENTKSKMFPPNFNFCFSFENSNPNPQERFGWGQLQWDHWLCQVRAPYSFIDVAGTVSSVDGHLNSRQNNFITTLHWGLYFFEFCCFPLPLNKSRFYLELSSLHPYIFLPKSSKLGQFSMAWTLLLSNHTAYT